MARHRIWTSLAAIALSAGLVAACGGPGGGDQPTGGPNEDGVTTLSLEAVQPTITSATAFGLNSSIHLADTPLGPKLVQMDIDYTFTRAEICRPRLHAFVTSAWRSDGLDPAYPVSAISGVADITLRRIRFVSDLDKPALFGTQSLVEK